jgi:hypothetical protein
VKNVDIESVKRWTVAGSDKSPHPASIATGCPGCDLQVVFTTRRRLYDAHRDTLSCSADCPSCSCEVHFWMTDLILQTESADDARPSLYMLPAAAPRMDLSTLADCLPDGVLLYCQSTQDVYNSGNLTATNIMVQSTLDAIFGSFLPIGNSRTTLSKLIQDSVPSIDLDKPLTKLATALRPDGYLDSLFRNSDSVNRDTADTLMALVEKLITYLYLLPAEFDELDRRLAELSRRTSGASATPERHRKDLKEAGATGDRLMSSSPRKGAADRK